MDARKLIARMTICKVRGHKWALVRFPAARKTRRDDLPAAQLAARRVISTQEQVSADQGRRPPKPRCSPSPDDGGRRIAEGAHHGQAVEMPRWTLRLAQDVRPRAADVDKECAACGKRISSG
jgi:hypothetical protein